MQHFRLWQTWIVYWAVASMGCGKGGNESGSSSQRPMRTETHSFVSLGAVQTKSTALVKATVTETTRGALWRLEYVAAGAGGEQVNLSIPHSDDFPTNTFDIASYQVEVPDIGREGISLSYYAEPITDPTLPTTFGALYKAVEGRVIVGAPSAEIEIEIQDAVFQDMKNPSKMMQLSGNVRSELLLSCEALGVQAAPPSSEPAPNSDGSSSPGATGGAGASTSQGPEMDENWSTPFCKAHDPR